MATFHKARTFAFTVTTPPPRPVLNLSRPFWCACGRPKAAIAGCAPCRFRDPPGALLIVQDGALYGWSDSNVRFECLSENPELLQRYLRREYPGGSSAGARGPARPGGKEGQAMTRDRNPRPG